MKMKSNISQICKHKSYTNRGGKRKCLGEKLGCLGGDPSPLDRTLVCMYFQLSDYPHMVFHKHVYTKVNDALLFTASGA